MIGNVMTTIGNELQHLAKQLESAGIDNARFEARLLLEHVLNVETQILIAYPERDIADEHAQELERLLARRISREPMSHILGYREFWSLKFKVTKDTLTPRPDSETLIDAVLSHLPDSNKALDVLDLGVGTGCLLLSVLSEYKNARGLGIDISEGALSVAKENAKNLNLGDRTDFRLGNWGENIDQTFDLILSNPPYIPLTDKPALEPEVIDHEPASALFAGEDGLDDYRLLAEQFPTLLKDDGLAVIELGIGQSDEVAELWMCAGLEVIGRPKDLGGIVRCHIIRKKS
ncbi:peptide chain release factor N(5)-glutamine methyltransferase [Terasakiella sp. A23]|uniref:peptide chain release factor N(5)-glutamine methyltransferase n=1 Tax=Terasakiella sp. FCG-A23 TaxID=3080561 RepID=UPI002955A08D|nr:peptide chain release factor N(5)-glutamine methyltransferase [Terasakiella sp. A23]MDV7339780.1 peptide chain release factor N(5)-glutamine methyltransferase [Terasakiella sp. A23]